MNIENADYLKRQVSYLGFGEKLNAELDKQLQSGKEKFDVPFAAEFKKGEKKDVVEYNLHFAKSKTNDMYFLNNYQATLKSDTPEKDKSQTFFINKSNNITAKEAYNLLDGRAVHKKLESKEGEPYEAWLQMTSKQKENGNFTLQPYNDKWGFDLEKNVNKIPMKELDGPEQKERLLKSLEKGNLHQVTLNLAGKEEKAFLEANPKERNIILYDGNMVKQNQGVKEHKGEAQGQHQGERTDSKTESAKKEQKAEPEPEEKKQRQRKASIR